MSFIELQKQLPIAGKGENEIYIIVDLQKLTRDVTAVTGDHVTENRGTRVGSQFMHLSEAWSRCRKITRLCQKIERPSLYAVNEWSRLDGT
jgi:hypothetical protein